MYVLFFLSDGSACVCGSFVIVKAIDDGLKKTSVMRMNVRIMDTLKPIDDGP